MDDAAVFGHLAEIVHAANHCETVRTTLERCPHLCALYELVRERYFVTQYIAGGAPLPTVNAPNMLGGQPPAPGTWFTDLKQGGVGKAVEAAMRWKQWKVVERAAAVAEAERAATAAAAAEAVSEAFAFYEGQQPAYEDMYTPPPPPPPVTAGSGAAGEPAGEDGGWLRYRSPVLEALGALPRNPESTYNPYFV